VSGRSSRRPLAGRVLSVSRGARAPEWGKRIIAAGKLDVGAVEYLETRDGRLMFYDINANSNLRPSIGQAFGFDPFERVVDFLVREMKRGATAAPRAGGTA
jgi:hypothetical protein